MPADLDGATGASGSTLLPPAGAPEYFLNFGSNVLRLWKFHVNFTTTSLSKLSGPTNISVASFTPACNGGTCIPQPDPSQQLDSLGDRLMYRLAYRHFSDHESLVTNHSVAAGNSVGVRWYELRNPGGTPVVYQQGTFAPDSNYRWMGSMAMDKIGNIALGYSESSSSLHPSIYFTGRLAGTTDPKGTMSAEQQIVLGGGSQIPILWISDNRWGDYSSMTVDPDDDCTFWYTQEFINADGYFNWQTQIAKIKLSGCQ
jgi:hypothetical protein